MVASAPRFPARRSFTTSSNRSIGKRLKVGYGARFNLSTAPPTPGNERRPFVQKVRHGQVRAEVSPPRKRGNAVRRLDTPRTASRERSPVSVNRGGPSEGRSDRGLELPAKSHVGLHLLPRRDRAGIQRNPAFGHGT